MLSRVLYILFKASKVTNIKILILSKEKSGYPQNPYKLQLNPPLVSKAAVIMMNINKKIKEN